MNSWNDIAYVSGSVAIAVLANYIAAQWAKDGNKFSWWLIGILVVSPLVFITFGLVTQRFGLSVAGALNDSLLTICTIIIGLVVLKEWNNISPWQYAGMFFSVFGIVLMGLFSK